MDCILTLKDLLQNRQKRETQFDLPMTDCHGVRGTVLLTSDSLSWRCFHGKMFILKIMIEF